MHTCAAEIYFCSWVRLCHAKMNEDCLTDRRLDLVDDRCIEHISARCKVIDRLKPRPKAAPGTQALAHLAQTNMLAPGKNNSGPVSVFQNLRCIFRKLMHLIASSDANACLTGSEHFGDPFVLR